MYNFSLILCIERDNMGSSYLDIILMLLGLLVFVARNWDLYVKLRQFEMDKLRREIELITSNIAVKQERIFNNYNICFERSENLIPLLDDIYLCNEIAYRSLLKSDRLSRDFPDIEYYWLILRNETGQIGRAINSFNLHIARGSRKSLIMYWKVKLLVLKIRFNSFMRRELNQHLIHPLPHVNFTINPILTRRIENRVGRIASEERECFKLKSDLLEVQKDLETYKGKFIFNTIFNSHFIFYFVLALVISFLPIILLNVFYDIVGLINTVGTSADYLSGDPVSVSGNYDSPSLSSYPEFKNLIAVALFSLFIFMLLGIMPNDLGIVNNFI